MKRRGLLVAVETSGPMASVALGDDGGVRGRVFLEGSSGHAAGLIPALEGLFSEAGVVRDDLCGVVVGSGPGSFTGVRVAAATAKGLAHALGLPLWSISSLEAAAVAERILRGVEGPWDAPGGSVRPAPRFPAGASGPGGARYVLFDARGDRVYAACYRIGPNGPAVLRPPRATRIGAILEEPRMAELRFVGSGALRHREAVQAAGGSVLSPPAGVPTAEGLLHVMAHRPGLEALEDPWRWQPDYLRASGAERARRP